MAQVGKNEIIHYLEKLKSMYVAIDENALRKDIRKIEEIIRSLHGKVESNPIKKQVRKKENTFRESLALLNERKYNDLKGTKVNFEHVRSSEDVITFFEIHSETHILSHTTALDLKLIYTILTGEHREIKGKKEELLQTVKRNIRARKRGEAFSR
ncbi:hypothetical protein [Bacillus suaedaesalsae]|uniref:Uncharacterized protein n=1 Tax=Bacillus suaedaesalsae TaxID=2810349 RepID=A0ABS2DMC3_9BACI|nr:hypothetical protein [Bacillus suaedaesalsae]MBM6619641.1 hypothetical protein [Bacillus suaedaesalsae]